MTDHRCFVFEEIKIVENVFDDLPHALLKDFVIFIFLKVHIHVHSLIVKVDWTPGMFLPVADLTFLFNNLGGCFSEEKPFLSTPGTKNYQLQIFRPTLYIFIPVLSCHNVTKDAYCTKVKSVDGTDEHNVARYAAWVKSDKKEFEFT